jgi:hypothetical protein
VSTLRKKEQRSMSNVEITNEPAPAPRATGRTSGRAHLKFVHVATGEVLAEVITDPMHENERQPRDDAKILDVGGKE